MQRFTEDLILSTSTVRTFIMIPVSSSYIIMFRLVAEAAACLAPTSQAAVPVLLTALITLAVAGPSSSCQ